MIFYECYADQALLVFLGFNSRDLKGGHSFGRSNVCSKLKKLGNSVGMIDEDPNSTQDAYLKYLSSLRTDYEDQYLIHITDKKLGNKLIVLRPNLEWLLLKIARDKKVDLSTFNLSNSEGEIHDRLRLQNNTRERSRMVEFVRAHEDHRAITKLKEFAKSL
jgi:hypothetical protein